MLWAVINSRDVRYFNVIDWVSSFLTAHQHVTGHSVPHKFWVKATMWSRVRTILVLGYWVLGNIHRYWVVLVLGRYFLLFWYQIQYQSDSSQHHAQSTYQWTVINIFSPACDLYSDSCNLLSGHRADMLLIIKHNHCHHHGVYDFSWSLLCYTLVLILVLGIGITRGQYYWVLDIGCLPWYRSNPNVEKKIKRTGRQW